MKIYTKNGDSGETSLIGGKKVPKFHLRIECYGTIDELNSFVGFLCAGEISQNDKNFLFYLQNQLFNVGTILACERGIYNFSENEVQNVENQIDKIEEMLPPLRNFILPSGDNLIALCNICRTICRRAERRIVELSQEVFVNQEVMKFINRLSDYFFVLGRKLAKERNISEIFWEKNL